MKQKSLLISLLSILFIFTVVFIMSCNSPGNNTKVNKNINMDKAPELMTKTNEGDPTFKRGKEVYTQVCLACHQENGSGVPMMFPPITNSDIINGDHNKLILLILNGMKGPVEIHGEQYNSVMPPQKDNLDDQQVADLLNYLRNSFGNSADEIAPEEVAKLRN